MITAHVSRSCSTCDTLNSWSPPCERVWCRGCGHRADVPRSVCDCGRLGCLPRSAGVLVWPRVPLDESARALRSTFEPDARDVVYVPAMGRVGGNRYRYNRARNAWEFDDGVGPWTLSANYSVFDERSGALHFLLGGYYAELAR